MYSLFLFVTFRYVFFLDPCKLDLINRKIKSIALCVSQCPQEELKTLSDVQKFAENNGKWPKPSDFIEKKLYEYS